jgi:hypothetical protein
LALGEDARRFLAVFLECMTVQANPPTQYRLNVAQGFLVEARQNLAAWQWCACVEHCRTLPAYSPSTDPSFWSPELV